MKNYNTYLSELREQTGLSLREAAKKIGIFWWKLYFYENGYYRPTKKDLKKLNDFYKVEIDITGESAYPAPTKEKALSGEKENLKRKRIVFGALSAGFLSLILLGAGLFNRSVNNTSSFYGGVYNDMRQKVAEKGDFGYDIVTSLKYHYVNSEPTNNDNAAFVFYETDNILYFNEVTYTKTVLKLGGEGNGFLRYRYQLGSNLGVDSYICNFNYGNVTNGSYFSCKFRYTGEKVEEIYDLKYEVEGAQKASYDEALVIVNSQLGSLDTYFSDLLSDVLGYQADFYDDFLPARELGRKTNFGLQITALFLIIPGIILFFIFFAIFIKSLVKNIKPRLVSSEPENVSKNLKPLPDDFHINIGVPDMFIVLIGKILQYGSMVLLLVAFFAKLGIGFLAAFSHPILLTVFKCSWLAGIFLEQFVMIGRIKKPSVLFSEIIYNLFFFLFIATIETVLISITNAWGYNMGPLVYQYIPSNVYQVVAVHYLIFLFLFFQPSFVSKKSFRILWHCLSFVPLGFLIATYFLSNGYALVYGVKENIFINFWFPNGFLLLSVVSVLFLYITFGIRLFYETIFGSRNAQLFFYGDRYTVFENFICAVLIIIAAVIDIIFANNQYAHYLGLGENMWLFFLVPFVIFCRYSPNNQQIFLVDQQFKSFARE